MSERAATACAVKPPALPEATFSVGGCNAFEITVTLYEHEKPDAFQRTWPADVVRAVDRHLAEWIARNPSRQIAALAQAVAGDCCKMIVYHRARAA